MFKKYLKIVGIIFSISAAPLAHAQDTLFSYDGSQISPGLAKSWKKEGDNKYSFTLDLSKKVGNKPLTPALVKGNLEGQLKAVGVKATPKGVDGIEVTFKGKEDNFLKKTAKVKIKATASETLAMDPSVSDGGIRAKSAERDPTDEEVKARVTAIKGDVIKAIVVKAGTSGQAASFSDGKVVSIKATGFVAKKNETFFFKPTQASGEVWEGKDFSK